MAFFQVHVIIFFLLSISVSDSSLITLHVNDNSNSSSFCELSLQIKNELRKFEINSFESYNIEIDKDSYILLNKCNSVNVAMDQLFIGSTQFVIDSYCNYCIRNYECFIFDVYRNKCQACTNRLRSLLSSNITTTATTPTIQTIKADETFFGRQFYGIPIMAYFAFLFGIVCIVWICCIIALCIGYSKRHKAIKAKGANIRRKRETKTVCNEKKMDNLDKPSAAKQINSLSATPNSKSEQTTQHITNIQQQVYTYNINNINNNNYHSPKTKPNIELQIVEPPNPNPNPNSNSKPMGMILPTNVLSKQSSIGSQKSYPSDNDIILQMEQDWASENGTNIFDSSPLTDMDHQLIELNASNPNIRFNSFKTATTTSNKTIPIIYAKTFGLMPAANPMPIRPIHEDLFDIDDRDEESQQTANATNSTLSTYQQTNISSNISESSRNYYHYKTTNNKNPFTINARLRMKNDESTQSNQSIRFPKESMPFPLRAKEKEKEKEKGKERKEEKKGIQIRIEHIEDIEEMDMDKSKSKRDRSLGSGGTGPFSPISNTPQPVSAPLSPKALSNTMPITPLSMQKKSPFHLPPPSILLQRIHSPEPPYTNKSKSKSHDSNQNGVESQTKYKNPHTIQAKPSHSQIETNNSKEKEYSLDQNDLFAKLSKIENDDRTV